MDLYTNLAIRIYDYRKEEEPGMRESGLSLFRLFRHKKSAMDARKTYDPEHIYTIEDFRAIIQNERARANRNNHKLTLVTFSMGSMDSDTNNTFLIIKTIKERVRCTDRVGWYGKREIGLILPYTSVQGAKHLAENICGVLNEQNAIAIYTVYSYPLDSSCLN